MISQTWFYVQMFANILFTAGLVTSFLMSGSLVRRLKAEKRRAEAQNGKLESQLLELEKGLSAPATPEKAPEGGLEVVPSGTNRNTVLESQDRTKILKLSRLGCSAAQIAAALDLPEPGVRLVLKTQDLTRRQWDRKPAAAVS